MNEADATCFVGVCVHLNVAHDCIGDQRAFSRLQRIFHGGERAAEIGISHAAALARTTVMTANAAVVKLSQKGGSANSESSSALLFDSLAQPYLSAAHFHRREKLPVRQHLFPLGGAGNSDVAFDKVINRLDVSVRGWPDRKSVV